MLIFHLIEFLHVLLPRIVSTETRIAQLLEFLVLVFALHYSVLDREVCRGSKRLHAQ